MPRKSIRKRTQTSREITQFIDSYFGRGSSKVKVSRNPETIVKVARKLDESKNIKFNESEFRKELTKSGRGLHMPLRRGKKQFIGLIDKLAETEVHERVHAAYARIKIKQGKSFSPVCSELIAHSFTLEWLRKKDFAKYKSVLREVHDLAIVGEISSLSKLKKLDEQTTSRFGFFLSVAMEKTFSEVEIQKLRKELFEKEFTKTDDLLKWYRTKYISRGGLLI
jgi:hypothetical protein